MNFDDTVTRYLQQLHAVQPGTARAWSSPLRRAAEPAGTYGPPDPTLNAHDTRRAKQRQGKPRAGLGGTELNDITTSALVMVAEAVRVEARTRRNGSGGYGARNNAVSALRAFFVWARRERLTDNHPDEGLDYSRKTSLQRRAYTPAELTEVREVLARSRDPELALLFLRLALETGARHNELLQLTYGDLRPSSGVLLLKRKGYAGRAGEAPLTATLFDALVAFAKKRTKGKVTTASPLLVYADGRPITRRYFENLCIKVREQVPALGQGGPDYFSTHGLRHTAATAVQRVGGDAVVRTFLGHSDRGFAHYETYSKATIDEVREAMVGIWGEPLAGKGHGYAAGEIQYERLTRIRRAETIERQRADWVIREDDMFTGKPDPALFSQLEEEMADDWEAEQRLQQRLANNDAAASG